MDAYVLIATKGRPDCVGRLVRDLERQTVKPAHVYVIGTGPDDVGDLQTSDASHPSDRLTVLYAAKPGLTRQRNAGLLQLMEDRKKQGRSGEFFATFFDDDFRPAPDWLSACGQTFESSPNIVGVTGKVLADGIGKGGLSEEDAEAYLNGSRPPVRHWASGPKLRDMVSLYGCNMAFRDVFVRNCLFDENLPLYGWQEDQDASTRARRYGRTVYVPECRGVHLGNSGGRVSGWKFGYSQIANQVYLVRKGTMRKRKATNFIFRHLVRNSVHSLLRDTATVDYPGRLLGNLQAAKDTLTGRCHPLRIV